MEVVSQDSDPHARTETLRASLNYSIEDGKLLRNGN